MSQTSPETEARLSLIRGIMEQAFFAPLNANDWLAYLLGQPGLLGLEDDESFDIFVRGAIAAETMNPENARGRTPLAWLAGMEENRPVTAHALSGLRHDRPFLFHRFVYSLSAVSKGTANPDDFDLVEDFLTEVLDDPAELRQAAEDEIETITKRGLAAADAAEDGLYDEKVRKAVDKIMAKSEIPEIASASGLLMWLAVGEGLEGFPDDIKPLAMLGAWRKWVGALTFVEPDLSFMGRIRPALQLDAQELALHVPPGSQAGHVIHTQCPYCGEQSSLKLGSEIEKLAGCDHLVYIGTTDEVHLMEVVSRFDLGNDFTALLASYYQSPTDLELFSTIVNDLYEMLVSQSRLEASPVFCPDEPNAFYYLTAYFAGPPPKSDA